MPGSYKQDDHGYVVEQKAQKAQHVVGQYRYRLYLSLRLRLKLMVH